ncbi:SRSF protein kinase 2, partial [Ceratobasidium sp. 395]
MHSVISPMDSDPSVPYRSERISPGGTRTVVYTIPDPPKAARKSSKPKTMSHVQQQQRPVDMIVEREESPAEYQPGGYLRVRIADRFAVQRYRVVRKLGWGHFSTVWLAHDAESDAHVALKIVKSAPRYSQTAADEIALLQHVIDCGKSDPAASDHPGRDRLVTFLDAFKHTNPRSGQIHSCIAFEPLGMNLLQLIQQPEHKHRGIPVQLCKQIARQTLHGLDYLHRVCGLIHT